MKIIIKAEFEIEDPICDNSFGDDAYCEIHPKGKTDNKHEIDFKWSNVVLSCIHCEKIWITDSDVFNELEMEIL